jgi:hypothetical protein
MPNKSRATSGRYGLIIEHNTHCDAVAGCGDVRLGLAAGKEPSLVLATGKASGTIY